MYYSLFIEEALQAGAEIARSYFGTVVGRTKPGDNNQVLTDADLAIGKHLISLIEKAYPNHNIIDEEVGVIDKQSTYTWVIDPIDGTSNFAAGVPTYGIMLGLLENNIPVAGGVALPAFNELYLAEKGAGAFLNGARIAITKETDLSRVLLAYGIDGKQNMPDETRAETNMLAELILASRSLRSNGSCFDVMQVAQGKFGASLAQTSKMWDNVAQHIIIEETGGIYTDFFGNQLDYANHLKRTHENFTWCAAPPSLHAHIQQIIQRTL